jgi:hypothetical protein
MQRLLLLLLFHYYLIPDVAHDVALAGAELFHPVLQPVYGLLMLRFVLMLLELGSYLHCPPGWKIGQNFSLSSVHWTQKRWRNL